VAGALKREGGDLLVSGGPDEVLTLQGEHAAHLPVTHAPHLTLQQGMEAHQTGNRAHQQEMEALS
jgi:hypothetical protein